MMTDRCPHVSLGRVQQGVRAPWILTRTLGLDACYSVCRQAIEEWGIPPGRLVPTPKQWTPPRAPCGRRRLQRSLGGAWARPASTPISSAQEEEPAMLCALPQQPQPPSWMMMQGCGDDLSCHEEADWLMDDEDDDGYCCSSTDSLQALQPPFLAAAQQVSQGWTRGAAAAGASEQARGMRPDNRRTTADGNICVRYARRCPTTTTSCAWRRWWTTRSPRRCPSGRPPRPWPPPPCAAARRPPRSSPDL